MKLVSYDKDEQDQLAILADDLLYDIDLMHPDLPVSMSIFLNFWEEVYPVTSTINKKIEEGKVSARQGFGYDAVKILAPIPHATSCRIAETQNKFNQHPCFYFINHNCFQGSGDVVCMPGHLQKLDFELQVAIVICKAGKNISVDDADEYTGGFMIMNNFCSRQNITEKLCSANGKGFAIPIGPALVTPDELEFYKIDCKPNHTGNAYNLPMKCFVNGMQISENNLADMDFTFAEIIAEASYGVQLFPGDIISCGTVPNGSFSELNINNKTNDQEQWLKPGDVVELEVQGLGKLTNTIVEAESASSVSEEMENE